MFFLTVSGTRNPSNAISPLVNMDSEGVNNDAEIINI